MSIWQALSPDTTYRFPEHTAVIQPLRTSHSKAWHTATKLFWSHSLQIYLQDNSCSRHKTVFNKHSANELTNKPPQEQAGKTQQGRTNL